LIVEIFGDPEASRGRGAAFELPFDPKQQPTMEQYAEYQRLSQEWRQREAELRPTRLVIKLDGRRREGERFNLAKSKGNARCR
jgi:hypothetical protein